MRLLPGSAALAATASLCFSPAHATDRVNVAITGIAREFDHHSVIQLGELHRSLQTHFFIQLMLRDPHFICHAADVVVEFGNSRLQNLADIYGAGGTLSEAQIESMWRETSVPLTWNTPVYRAVYDTIRDINSMHLCPHPVRIVLADAPLDWARIRAVKDLLPFADRDAAMADTVEREVMAKHHHAFLITGEFHAEKRTNDEADGLRTAQIIERRHPHALFSIVTIPAALAGSLHMDRVPSFLPVSGSGAAGAPFAMTMPGWSSARTAATPGGLRIGDVVDGLLYVGGNYSLFPSPAIYLDQAYAQELRRRSAIIKEAAGQDFVTVVDDLVKEGRDQVALAHPVAPPATPNRR